jgi:peptidoglycan/xylan/chitin deacetylase (PgdA/CDA1 family)
MTRRWPTGRVCATSATCTSFEPFEPDVTRGVFTLSLDFELIWGTLDRGAETFRRACETERALVIDRLLALLEEFDVPATWCILGHLFLDSCEPSDGHKHPEIKPPSYSRGGRAWFADDPCGTEETDPIFYGRSLVEKIRACPVPQEIGCHSFSHPIFGDPGCSREAAETELAECVRLARESGLEMRSFAFPRNRVGHLDVLREHGFACYRGPEPTWYELERGPRTLRRFGHLVDVLTARRPPVVEPEEALPGLWNLPGSMIYLPMHGPRRFLPVSVRVARARKGLDAAAQSGRVFHLWFHPTNLADEIERAFSGLRRVFEHAASLRAQGRLATMPMSEVLGRYVTSVNGGGSA